MARRRGRSSPPGRSATPIVSPSPLSPPSPLRSPIVRYVQVFPPRDLRVFEDRRRYHPLKALAPAGIIGRRAARRIVERPVRNALDAFPALRLGFAVPEKVVKCVRRKQRREVIFALGKRGRGAAARRRRRDQFSDVSCKR